MPAKRRFSSVCSKIPGRTINCLKTFLHFITALTSFSQFLRNEINFGSSEYCHCITISPCIEFDRLTGEWLSPKTFICWYTQHFHSPHTPIPKTRIMWVEWNSKGKWSTDCEYNAIIIVHWICRFSTTCLHDPTSTSVESSLDYSMDDRSLIVIHELNLSDNLCEHDSTLDNYCVWQGDEWNWADWMNQPWSENIKYLQRRRGGGGRWSGSPTWPLGKHICVLAGLDEVDWRAKKR